MLRHLLIIHCHWYCTEPAFSTYTGRRYCLVAFLMFSLAFKWAWKGSRAWMYCPAFTCVARVNVQLMKEEFEDDEDA